MSMSSTKPPATSSLPNTASKPAAVPTSEKGKGPAVPIPKKGKWKDIWGNSSPPEKLSKRARKRLNQEVNPALFGYVTNESNSEEECDMRRAIRVLRDEQTQVIYKDNRASSSVPNSPRKTVARKGSRDCPPSHGNTIPLFNGYAEWRSYLACVRDPRMHNIETIQKIKHYVVHAQQASLRTWIQAVVLEPVKKEGALPQPRLTSTPQEWKNWIEFYSREFNGIPLEGGTVSLRNVRGHILVLRLNPTFKKGTSERRRTIFQYRLHLLALVPGLYRKYLAMFAWPIAPTFEPVRFEGHVNNLMEDDVARHLAQCGVTLHQVDDIQPYARHWLGRRTRRPQQMPGDCGVPRHDEQISLLADPPTMHNLVTASATSGLVAGGFAATNPLSDVDHEMATVVPNNERQLIIGRPRDSPPPGEGAVSLNYGEGDVPINMSVDTAHVLSDPTGHPNVPASEAPPSTSAVLALCTTSA
ncbi:hypothetical protein BV22DRAFT_1052640 [Leucogyrophana mollusca]|uniref:Uncharacterized protein n=1 Tax=Leucogyrophana mollusca TaxID=85980 RepID=A0ACB8AV69_9AGAM|nr:hypothetical protein BV22DRAFT_1052640 [Leucogyrophana mollusca]